MFNSSIKISHSMPMESSAIWPHSVEICITRIPIRKRDGYSLEFMKSLASKLKASMAPNGIVYLICYAPIECKFRPFEIGSEMVKAGFNHVDNIVVEKTWLPGKRSENNLVNSHDYVLFFCNGDVWKIDRSPIRQYLMLDEAAPCIGNTWLVETGSLDESYSDDLAALLIRMADLLPGSSVFDPFMGNSAILKACLNMGHSLTGFEMDKRKIKQYEKIIEDFKKKELNQN
ncbi:hypothetical protein EBR43_09435 [bacterium]|nr:hypothetical protein [bacterium]